MRDIYIKTHVSQKVGVPSSCTAPTTPGYHDHGKLIGYSVCLVKDVPETVSDHLAVFTFNSCAVLGHTVEWRQLGKGHVIRGEGLAWDRVIADPVKVEA